MTSFLCVALVFLLMETAAGVLIAHYNQSLRVLRVIKDLQYGASSDFIRVMVVIVRTIRAPYRPLLGNELPIMFT